MSVPARVFRVARLLLLAVRTLTLALTLTAMSACALPIGPDFQDPLASPNYAPFIESSTPPLGQILMRTATDTTTFRVTVSDPNVGDLLYVRWIVEGPPPMSSARVVLDTAPFSSTDGMPLHAQSSLEIGCQLLASGLTLHPVTVIVADRKFDLTSLDLTKLQKPEGLTSQGNWTLNQECP
jgi:hypothetical protein